MSATRKPFWTYLATVLGGALVVTLITFWQYQAKMEAFKGFADAAKGDKNAITAVGDGMLGSVVGGMLLGLTVVLAVFLATYLTRDIKPGIVLGVLCAIPLGVTNTMLFRYVSSESVFASEAAQQVLPSVGQWASAIEMTLFPAVFGVVGGFFAGRFMDQKQEREAHRPRILTREELAAIDERDRARKAGGVATVAGEAAPVVAEPAAETTTAVAAPVPPEPVAVQMPASAPSVVAAPAPPEQQTAQAATPVAQQSEQTPMTVPQQPPPASAEPAAPTPRPQVPRGQRRSVTCPKCRASNAPMRTHCLSCGTALAI